MGYLNYFSNFSILVNYSKFSIYNTYLVFLVNT